MTGDVVNLNLNTRPEDEPAEEPTLEPLTTEDLVQALTHMQATAIYQRKREHLPATTTVVVDVSRGVLARHSPADRKRLDAALAKFAIEANWPES